MHLTIIEISRENRQCFLSTTVHRSMPTTTVRYYYLLHEVIARQKIPAAHTSIKLWAQRSYHHDNNREYRWTADKNIFLFYGSTLQ
jgi:hypothetical protein